MDLIDRGAPEDSSQILRLIDRLKKEHEKGRKVALLTHRPFAGHAADTCLRIPLSIYETYQDQINSQFSQVVYLDE